MLLRRQVLLHLRHSGRGPAPARLYSSAHPQPSSSPSSASPSPDFPPRPAPNTSQRPTPARPLPHQYMPLSSATAAATTAATAQARHIPVSDPLRQELHAIVSSFKAPIRHAFAYGSAVFDQAGYSSSDKPLLDLIFAVSHPSHWHSINLHQNPSHYALVPRLSGSDFISWFQSKPAHMWFNVDCNVSGRRLKYGVISVDALCNDLLEWETLYASGRMQKPIYTIRETPRISLANEINLSHALRKAILSLPESFSEQDLYREITSTSYKGDFRMAVGENPHKINNIVTRQMDEFQQLYHPLLENFRKHIVRASPMSTNFARDMSVSSRVELSNKLPNGLRDHIRSMYISKWNLQNAFSKISQTQENPKEDKLSQRIIDASQQVLADDEEKMLWERIVSDPEFKNTIDIGTQAIVSKSAWMQTLKGIISAGPLTSVSYAWPKLMKKIFQ